MPCRCDKEDLIINYIKSSVINAHSIALIILLVSLMCAPADSAGNNDRRKPDRPQIIISTDVATGLIDTHGGKSLSPGTFSSTYAWGNDTGVAPQDIDDGLALAMLLNLQAEHLVDVLAVIPIYGNASLPAQMLVARHITYALKGRTNIPIVAGATSPASQILHATPIWFDGSTLQIQGPHGSFQATCRNLGVELMETKIKSSKTAVTLLALGPATDIACLVNTAKYSTLRKIKEIITIASRLEGESVQINGLVVNDFNFRLDPIAGTLLLGVQPHRRIPIKLMSFSLTGQTSQAGDVIAFDADTYPGPEHPDPKSERSFAWLLNAAGPRNEFWSSIFGTFEGPFDQYAVIAAIWPELFDCQPALAYVQQCPTPAWSPDFPTDDEGNPSEHAYNKPGNPCVDHGTLHGASLSEITAQLITTLDLNDPGPLVRGQTGIDGNIPALDSAAVPVTACVDFANAVAREEFEELLKKYTW